MVDAVVREYRREVVQPRIWQDYCNVRFLPDARESAPEGFEIVAERVEYVAVRDYLILDRIGRSNRVDLGASALQIRYNLAKMFEVVGNREDTATRQESPLTGWRDAIRPSVCDLIGSGISGEVGVAGEATGGNEEP